jgi:hypothetical protein
MSLRGSVLELEARIRWLDELSRALGPAAPVATPIATRRIATSPWCRPRGPRARGRLHRPGTSR